MANNYGLPEPLNEQTIIYKVSEHLLTQGRPSRNSDKICVYRTPRIKLACAVGCLIEDGNPMLESTDVVSTKFLEKAEPKLIPYQILLRRLQRVHDGPSDKMGKEYITKVAAGLIIVADEYKVNTDPIRRKFDEVIAKLEK